MDDFLKRAQEALNTERTRWIPQEGEVLAGTLVQMRSIEGQWGDFRVAVIKPRTGEKALEVSEKTALKEPFNELEKRGPGCLVAIKYLGRRQGKNGGQAYEAYTCYSEPATAAGAQPSAAAPAAPVTPAVETVAQMTERARTALAASDQDALAKIGARARELGYQWDRADQVYRAAQSADATL